MVRDADQYTATTICRFDALQDAFRPWCSENLAGHIDIEQAWANQADHGWFVTTAIANDEADPAFSFWMAADNQATLGQPHNIRVCQRKSFQHVPEDVLRLVDEFLLPRRHQASIGSKYIR
jgi:hypothetical protein